ncbi:MAG: DegT/DnrJ/EryC1/StrS aminotransferase family protein [Candidatus Andersenbacteria bacterium]|nr:DegT/DnrJ/EryC1/StrS aminotransferase family protein [Candidatus Andersenbacteria bacterium]MBI3250252.1 DegT/DnrJ/EryC1/StrS aminotransferase family protein [Candidatus Andersenbacteria bacterium]
MKTLISKNRPSHTGLDFISAAFASPTAVGKFERAFARKVGTTFAVTFPYCRVAIQALLEVTTTPGQFVVLPAYTCSVVAHAITRAHLKSHFIDVRAKDFNAPVSTLLEKVDDRTAAIVPTHMYGNRLVLDELNELSRPMVVIEDASLSMHPAWKSPNPKLTVATVYSLGSNKILSTIRGGVVATDDFELVNKLREWQSKNLRASNIRERIVFLLQLAALIGAFGPYLYSVIDRLRYSRLLRHQLDTRSLDEGTFPSDAMVEFSPSQAALGLRQLPRTELFLHRRQHISQQYTRAFSGHKELIPMTIFDNSHLSHYALRVPNRDKLQVREKLRAAGIESGVTFDYLVPELPLYRKDTPEKFPNGSTIVRELVNLPNYPALTDKQVGHIIKTILDIVTSS